MIMQHSYKLHGIPKDIVRDYDPKFTSNFWKQLFELTIPPLMQSINYNPQIDGLTEIVSRGILENLCFRTRRFPVQHGCTIAVIHDPPLLIYLIIEDSQMQDFRYVGKQVKDNLILAQDKMKSQRTSTATRKNLKWNIGYFLILQPSK